MDRMVRLSLTAAGTGLLLAIFSSRDVSGDAGANGCPSGLPGPSLVFIPAGDAAYCMDAHEVKQREYAVFLEATKDKFPGQSAECAWNDRLLPIPIDDDGPRPVGSCASGVFDPVRRGDYSMVCADWCDAKAYCEWAGKRLCGGLGQKEETLATQSDPHVSEWQYACTNGGRFPYPYGAQYVEGKCIDENTPRTNAIAGSVGSVECMGAMPPYDQIVDLAGSVTEWTAACNERYCSIQGGPHAGHPASCAFSAITPVRTTSAAVGFRCCANAIEVRK